MMNSKIFLTGFMGSGKTFWGKVWAKENQLEFFDLDEQIEKILGDTITNIFEQKGEAYFREREREVLEKFALQDNFILACGGGTPCFFDNLQWMDQNGVTIYLQATANEIFNRISDETNERPLLKKLSKAGLLIFIEQKLKEREPFYKQAGYMLNVGDLSKYSLGEVLRNVSKE